MQVILRRFQYQYMEYEKFFCKSEISAFFPDADVSEKGRDYYLDGVSENELEKLYELTYIESFFVRNEWKKTFQGLFEDDGTPATKQRTRYSSHGLHEYKGKFNPQIVRAISNHIGISKSSMVLDPFNGSGTTLVECAHVGISAFGTDINPMACFISNAKIGALTIIPAKVKLAISTIEKGLTEAHPLQSSCNERVDYLIKWIPEKTLAKLEYIRSVAEEYEDNVKNYLLLIASDLIRDYSNQEPGDLRIRRRATPFPDEPFEKAFCNSARKHLTKIERMQKHFPNIKTSNYAYHCDIKQDDIFESQMFDAAITSPPYATALPYIDTQRISLIWLKLCKPMDIGPLEASLIGSRELLKAEKRKWECSIADNLDNLPDAVYSLILDMNGALADSDGFRKQAVPTLMYRYFSEMKQMFLTVSKYVKCGGRYALVVGHNKTTLGGKKYLIDTPKLLSILAEGCGWRRIEILPLQTYKRYGLNSKNAINLESLIVLENLREEK